MKFYHCALCGNVADMASPSGVVPVCCGQPMTLMVANSTDAAGEKHVPAVTREGAKVHVQVGSVPHPMVPEHYIHWVVTHQGDHVQRIHLKPEQEPVAEFVLKDAAAPVTVYEYCNLHGLWKTEA